MLSPINNEKKIGFLSERIHTELKSPEQPQSAEAQHKKALALIEKIQKESEAPKLDYMPTIPENSKVILKTRN